MERSAIIVAGGNGKRMGGEVPKQFLLLNGEPLLFHTIRAFHSYHQLLDLIIVLPKEHHQRWQELCAEHVIQVPHQVISGGAERYHSVKAGLGLIHGEGLVAVHDGVRPLVSKELIGRCFDAAAEHGAAIPVVPIAPSVREITGEGSRSVDRSTLRLVQTPQCFRVDLLKQAFEQPFDAAFTDEATMVERLGAKVHLVAGEEQNVKVTTPFDLAVAEAALQR